MSAAIQIATAAAGGSIRKAATMNGWVGAPVNAPTVKRTRLARVSSAVRLRFSATGEFQIDDLFVDPRKMG